MADDSMVVTALSLPVPALEPQPMALRQHSEVKLESARTCDHHGELATCFQIRDEMVPDIVRQ